MRPEKQFLKNKQLLNAKKRNTAQYLNWVGNN